MFQLTYFTVVFRYLLAIVLFVRVLVEPGAELGLYYYLRPDWEKMRNIRVGTLFIFSCLDMCLYWCLCAVMGRSRSVGLLHPVCQLGHDTDVGEFQSENISLHSRRHHWPDWRWFKFLVLRTHSVHDCRDPFQRNRR